MSESVVICYLFSTISNPRPFFLYVFISTELDQNEQMNMRNQRKKERKNERKYVKSQERKIYQYELGKEMKGKENDDVR